MPSSTKEHNLLVFLSYARENKSIVEKLYKRLKGDGFTPWMDEKDLLPGQDWPLEIDRAMRRGHVILLCFSETSLTKESFIHREYKRALDLQLEKPSGTIFVIPVRLDGCAIPEFLSSLQCVEYPKGYKKLLLALEERARKVFPEPPRAPVPVKAEIVEPVRTAQVDTRLIPAPPFDDTATQVIDRIFNLADLEDLVGQSFPSPGELQEILAETFPAGAAKPSTQEFIAEFIRNHEIARLMGEIKRLNPSGYRDYLSTKALAAVGLSPREIPSIETDAKTIESELLSLQKTAIAQQRGLLADSLEFEDREDLFNRIRTDKGDHIVLHGPSGVGKSHILKQLQEKYLSDTRCVLIDLSTCKPKDILRLSLEQLGGEPRPADEYQELARCINNHLNGVPRIRRFYFFFDNADHNQPALDYLFSPDNLIQNPRLQRYLEGWDLTGKVQLKIIVAARHPVKTPSAVYPAFSRTLQIKIEPLKKHSVQNMLDKIVERRKIPVFLGRIMELSEEVYYLTGGHPKCTKQMLVALAEQGCVMPTAEEWVQLYKEHVIATIHAEMLQPADFELLSMIWSLSIFRRFDQRLLGGLLERGILLGLPGEKSRQAREWRTRLDTTNFFEEEVETSTTITNYVMRHALSLNLQLDAPNRYRALHAIALQMYLDRFLSSEAGTEKRIERLAVNLFELLYHWTKLLDIELRRKDTRAKARPACPRIREAFENYLLLALTMLQNENQSAFFQVLRSRWDHDEELQEAIRRSTPQEDCLQELHAVIQKYTQLPDGLD